MYDIKLDEKYHLRVEKNGEVRILRYGKDWLNNPEGSNAWISAADVIETLLEGREVEKISEQRQEAISETLLEHLRNPYDDNDALELEALTKKFAEYVGLITSDSLISPEQFVERLLNPHGLKGKSSG